MNRSCFLTQEPCSWLATILVSLPSLHSHISYASIDHDWAKP